MSKKKKSVMKNYIYNMLYEILAIIIPLITTPYLSRILGAENIGIYSYTISITTYFILFGSLGIAMYGKREIAYVQNDIKERTKTFFEIFLLRCITLSISLFLFYVSFCKNGDYHVYYSILSMEIIANIIDISWFFQGMEEFKKTVIRNTIVKIISVICIFLFIKSASDLYKYFIIYTISTFIGNITLWLYIPNFIEKVKIKSLNLKKHIKPTVVLFIPQIATQVYTVLDKTMIGTIIENKIEVGYYEQAQKIIKLLLTIATSLGSVMMPRIAATYAKGDQKKVNEYMNKSFSFITMITIPLAFGICSISYKFVPIFFGRGYEKVSPILCVISPIIVLIGLSNVTGTQYLLPTKQQKKYTFSVIIGAIINFILNLILIKKYKSIGASFATVIAELSVTITQFILIRKEINIKKVFKMSYKYLLASISIFIISSVIGLLIKNNLISLALQILISSIVYMLILILLKDVFLLENINKIKAAINGKIKNNKIG